MLAGLAQGGSRLYPLLSFASQDRGRATRRDYAEAAGVAFAPFDQFDPSTFDLVVDGVLGTGPARPCRAPGPLL